MIEVIVPNWNGMKVLPRTLKSLSRQTMSGFRVTVVDNGSRDGSVEYVREQWPNVRVLVLAKNFGFCRAVNQGIRQSAADLIALLNNDAEAEPVWLEALYRAAEKYPNAGSFASKVLMAERGEYIESAGDLIKPDASGANRGRGEVDRGQYDQDWHLRQEFVNSTLCQIKNLPTWYFVRNSGSICLSHLRSLTGLIKDGAPRVLLACEKDLFRRIPRALLVRAMLWRASKGRFDRLAFFLPPP